MIEIYDHNYEETWTEPCDSIEEAVEYALADLPHEDYPYLIGDDTRISAIVFQGLVYYPLVNGGAL